MNLTKSCKQKPFLADRFWEKKFLGWNLKGISVKYSFNELLIFFWITLVDFSVWSLASHCIQGNYNFLASSKKHCIQIHTPKETNNEMKVKKNIFTLVSDVDVVGQICKNSVHGYHFPKVLFFFCLFFGYNQK